MKVSSNKVPIFGIQRLRMGTDGHGITTLVAFMGCPLNCKYCINDFCHEPIYNSDGVTPRTGVELLSPKELYDRVKIDDIYFQTSGGGICFGGGEPAMYSKFIEEFHRLCGDRWKITIESSLSVSSHHIKTLLPIIDHWIVDIKETDSKIYRQYTGRALKKALDNLKLVIVRKDILTVRVPLIKSYNTEEDVLRTIAKLNSMGISDIDRLTYITSIEKKWKKQEYTHRIGEVSGLDEEETEQKKQYLS